AYLEPPSVAFKSKAEVDRNFVELMNLLLETGVYPAIATHDEKIVEQTKRFVESRKISRDSFEFQMLYGIRRDIQKRLVNEGYRLRLYVPYGQAWYPYFMRRLAERPAHVFFLGRNPLGTWTVARRKLSTPRWHLKHICGTGVILREKSVCAQLSCMDCCAY